MKFRVSGTPIAAALLKLIELDQKRGRVFFRLLPSDARASRYVSCFFG